MPQALWLCVRWRTLRQIIDGGDGRVNAAHPGTRSDPGSKDRLFLERGYAATSTDAILSISGGSKKTLYELFGNKAGVFRAVVESATASLLTAIEASGLDPAKPADAPRRIGIEFFSMWMSPETLGLVRFVIAEGPRIPQIGDIVLRCGSKGPETALVTCLAHCGGAGTLVVARPQTLANAFISLLVRPVLLALVTQRPLSPIDVARHVDMVLPHFLSSCAPGRARNARDATVRMGSRAAAIVAAKNCRPFVRGEHT